MPEFIYCEAIDLESEIAETTENGGRSKKTIQREKCVLRTFEDFISRESSVTFDSLISTESMKSDLEDVLVKFFCLLRVKNKENELDLPMRNTAEGYKSHLKNAIQKLTDNRYDISCPIQFKKFHEYYKG